MTIPLSGFFSVFDHLPDFLALFQAMPPLFFWLRALHPEALSPEWCGNLNQSVHMLRAAVKKSHQNSGRKLPLKRTEGETRNSKWMGYLPKLSNPHWWPPTIWTWPCLGWFEVAPVMDIEKTRCWGSGVMSNIGSAFCPFVGGGLLDLANFLSTLSKMVLDTKNSSVMLTLD